MLPACPARGSLQSSLRPSPTAAPLSSTCLPPADTLSTFLAHLLAALCSAEAAVVAALLHDVLDDTDADAAEVEALFGEQVGCLPGQKKCWCRVVSRQPAHAVCLLSAAPPKCALTSSNHCCAAPGPLLYCPTPPPCCTPCLQVASMVSKVSQLSTTNQIVRRRLRVESAQPTKEEEAQLRWVLRGRILVGGQCAGC